MEIAKPVVRGASAKIMKSILFVGVLALAAISSAGQEPQLPAPLAEPALQKLLGFEYADAEEWAGAWRGGPAGTVRFENASMRSGTGAVVIERGADAGGEFSALTTRLPVAFEGSRVELTGFLKTEAVVGRGALWLRSDSDGGVLAIDNMAAQRLDGTTEWREFSVRVPLSSDAKWLAFGALLEGTGKLEVDDLRLLVDGSPIWRAQPRKPREETVLDRDREFDGGSKISLSALTAAQVENLAMLGRVWGFLKYHHPAIVAGERHWDYDLFRVLPAVLAASDREAWQAVLVRWIDGLGQLASAATVTPAEEGELHLRPESAWLGDVTLLGADLSARLRAIHACRAGAAGQFFVALRPGVGNPDFRRELYYSKVELPDPGFQLLALFRYWNAIRYWFPYRNLIEGDWDAVLREFVPRVAFAADRDAYRLAMLALAERVGDSHAGLPGWFEAKPPVGNLALPVRVRFVEGQATVAERFRTPQEVACPLEPGDVIEALDGVAVEELLRRWRPYYPASNEPTKLRNLARVLTKGKEATVQVAIRRGTERRSLSATRVPLDALPARDYTRDLPGDAFRLLSPDVAYLKLSGVRGLDLKDCIARAAGTKGMIVDISNYPAAFVVFTLGGHFVTQPTEFARFTVGDLAEPGAFRFTKSLALPPLAPTYAGKLVVLLDEISQSNAEYTAMALRAAPGAKVIGSTTAGADGNVSDIPLPGGLHSSISGIGVFYPDKRPTQRVGIVPDIEVRPTVEGIRAGRDEVLEAAWREILGADADLEPLRALVRQSANEKTP